MKKIESGEMKPIRTNWQATQRNTPGAASAGAKPKEKYTDALSALGIEFAGEAPVKATAPMAATTVPATVRPSTPRPLSPKPAATRLPAPSQPTVSTEPQARPSAEQVQHTTAPVTQAGQVESRETISLHELTKPVERTSKPQRAPRAEVSISALRDAIKASLNQDIAASDSGDSTGDNGGTNPPAPDAQKANSEENEDDDYEKDRSYRGR